MCRLSVIYSLSYTLDYLFWLCLQFSLSWPDNVCLWDGLYFETGRFRKLYISCPFFTRLQFCLMIVWQKWHLLDFLPRKTLGVSGSGLTESEDNTFSSESVLSLLDINRHPFTKSSAFEIRCSNHYWYMTTLRAILSLILQLS